MSQISSPQDEVRRTLTQHAMLVIWGLYAQQIGLVKVLEQVPLAQKRRTHTPQSKVLEFFVAMLAGLAHLQELSRAAHPLDQDRVTAEAWGQPGWADYSGVSRTLQRMSAAEGSALRAALDQISQPFIDQEVARALQGAGVLVLDGDLTGRPVSSSSQSYPDTAFGYLGDTIALGYQAALVSLHSPTYGRLWLASQLHPGDTVSCTQAQALVQAAEARTQRRPRRRVELAAERLAQAQCAWQSASEQLETSRYQAQQAQARYQETQGSWQVWHTTVTQLQGEYQRTGRQPSAHCQLSRAQRKVATYAARLPVAERVQSVAARRLARHEARYDVTAAEVTRLQAHYRQLCQDNATNEQPIRAILRLDSGFASGENLAWLIEMGYELYSKGRTSVPRERLLAEVSAQTVWTRVGANAHMTAWQTTTVAGHFIYSMTVALARYQTGATSRHALLLYYGPDPVAEDLVGWFHTYNGRQTIEAGIKEGKNVFQMHHLKVRTAPALQLQEALACFAANFVRFAAKWIADQPQPQLLPTHSVKHMVQVAAHTSAWVQRQGPVWQLTFTDHSLYAGGSLRFGAGPLQLSLPWCDDIHFAHF